MGNSLTSLRSWALSLTKSNTMTPTVGNDLSLTLAPQAALSLTKSNTMTPTVGNSLSKSSCI